jgi:hypothetical protein
VAAALSAAPNAAQITSSTTAQLEMSFSSASQVAAQYPQYATQITEGAKTSFLAGADWAYTAGIVAILLGFVIVYVRFPKRDEEERLLAAYHAEDTGQAG